MTMYAVISALRLFLRILSAAIFVYWILTLLRFNNRFVEILARFIYPFVRPFRRPASCWAPWPLQSWCCWQTHIFSAG